MPQFKVILFNYLGRYTELTEIFLGSLIFQSSVFGSCCVYSWRRERNKRECSRKWEARLVFHPIPFPSPWLSFLSAPSNLQLTRRRKSNLLPADRRSGQSISPLQSNFFNYYAVAALFPFYVFWEFQQWRQSYDSPFFIRLSLPRHDIPLSCCMPHMTAT
jgi:hypothetical protein